MKFASKALKISGKERLIRKIESLRFHVKNNVHAPIKDWQ